MIKIGIVSINTTIANLDNNLGAFAKCIDAANARNIDLLIFPRRSFTGTGNYDFSTVPGIDAKIDECLAALATQSDHLSAVLSYVTTKGEKIALISNGKIMREFDVSDDSIDLKLRIDGSGTVSLSDYPDNDANTVLVRYELYPFSLGERQRRLRKLANDASRFVLAQAQTFGTDDCRIFDGSGSISFPDGKQYAVPPFPAGDFAILSTNIDASEACVLYDDGRLADDLSPRHPDIFEELENALSFALADYMKKSGHANLCLALSGGRDSVFCAILAQKALARLKADDARFAGELYTAYLPSDFSGSVSRVAAEKIAEACRAKHCVIPVGKLYAQTLDLLEKHANISCDWQNDDLMLQNLQARIRSSTIWALANKYGALLITTGNMSEAAVGYSTMDGDSSGALALIAGVPKTMIVAYLHWAERHIPELSHVNAQVPTAELRPPEQKQSDEKDLMPYVVLDYLIESFIGKRTPIHALDNCLLERFPEIPADMLKGYRSKFLRMLTFSQWKRNRNANSFVVLDYGLHDKNGWHISSLHHNLDRIFNDSRH